MLFQGFLSAPPFYLCTRLQSSHFNPTSFCFLCNLIKLVVVVEKEIVQSVEYRIRQLAGILKEARTFIKRQNIFFFIFYLFL